MTKAQHKLAAKFSKVLIEDMFQLKQGETVAITADSGSNKIVIDALTEATKNAGGIPLVMWIPRAKEESQAGMKYWPSKALTAALCNVDVWIEAQSMVILYSDIWETAMDENKALRYLIIADSTPESLERVFTGYSVPILKTLLNAVKDMVMRCNTVRITSKNGTNVSYDIDLNYAFDIDDGDYSQPKFGTAPGFVNIVPKLDSMSGIIVFDHLQNAENGSQLQFIMKKGKIVDVVGGKEAKKFKEYLASFEDENMYKISHNMIGLNPKVTSLSGELVEDERIWGGVDFGFGHTSAMDMPPFGQMAKSHFDGVVAETSIFFDETQITNNGHICHEQLMLITENLLTAENA
ncbi:MAG: hypothetical protein ACON5F_07340 [Jejuia sp.]